jgi:hypothetical protein
MRQSEMYELCLNSWKIPNLERSLFASIQEEPYQQQRPKGRYQKKKAKYDPNSIIPDQLLQKLYSKVNTSFRQYQINKKVYFSF